MSKDTIQEKIDDISDEKAKLTDQITAEIAK